LKEKLMADYAVYDTTRKIWKLHNVVIRTNDSINEKIVKVPEMEMVYPFTPHDLNKGDAIKEALTTPQLDLYIKAEQMRGQENLNTFLIEKARRTATPFAGIILTIIGACIASRKIRGGSGLHLALGIAISAIFVMSLQISTTFATKSNLDPNIAVWIPNIIFGILAFVLYRRQLR
jgi:lipopolysaccharide export system permease protein